MFHLVIEAYLDCCIELTIGIRENTIVFVLLNASFAFLTYIYMPNLVFGFLIQVFELLVKPNFRNHLVIEFLAI